MLSETPGERRGSCEGAAALVDTSTYPRYSVPMTPEQARFLLDYVLPTLKHETATTAKVIAATPNANLDYRPSDRCMPAAELLWHIASADVMFLEGVVNGAFKGSEKPESVTSPEQISAWYTERMSPAIEKLSAFTPDDAARVLNFHDFLKAPAAGIVTFAMSHSVHHRGQLSAYLRPMGGKVPSIYGASADEKPLAKAEAQ
jgi:uncharacterized damage-inducible protein DinB